MLDKVLFFVFTLFLKFALLTIRSSSRSESWGAAVDQWWSEKICNKKPKRFLGSASSLGKL